MGNKNKSREFMKQREDVAALVRAQTEERELTADVHLRGIGFRRIQLIEQPSFSEGSSWDVRQLGETWSLYRGKIPITKARVLGHDKQDIESAQLQRYFEELCAADLPLRPDLSGTAGCDGTMCQMAIFGDLFTAIRLEWWSDYPRQWTVPIDIANRMMADFKQRANVPSGRSA